MVNAKDKLEMATGVREAQGTAWKSKAQEDGMAQLNGMPTTETRGSGGAPFSPGAQEALRRQRQEHLSL